MMTASDHMARCRALSGGVTESEAAIIADLGIAEKAEAALAQLREESVPDAKRPGLPKSPEQYLRTRAAHIIMDYAEKALGYRVNELAHEVETMRVDLMASKKRADMYADLCRGVAEALGLPTEGEGSSWHDLPEKVRIALLSHPAPAAPDALREAITVYVDRLRRGRDKHYINTLCVADDLDAALAPRKEGRG